MEKRGEIIEVSFNVLVTDEDIDDIMVSALEGGINHWCAEAKVQGNISESSPAIRSSTRSSVLLYDVEERKYEELTKEKFLAGMKRYLEHPITRIPFIRERMREDICWTVL